MARHPPLRDTVGMAVGTLQSNRLRSLLTMLGIVIGNASVITLVGVGRGAQNLAAAQLNVLGSNVVFVAPGSHNARHQGVSLPRTLVLADAEAIAEQVPSVRAVAPQISLSEVAQAGSRTKTVAVHGVTPAFLGVRRMDVERGRFFTAQDLRAAHNVVVIAAFTPLPATLDGVTVLLTLGISSSIGLVFGVLPARRAAQLDPITALQAH